MLVAADGSIASSAIYRALVRNRAQLTYNGVGPWLEGTAAAPPKVAASPELAAQLKLQDEAAGALREARHRLGALTFDRLEAQPVIADGQVTRHRGARSQPRRAPDRRFHDRGQRGDGADAARRRASPPSAAW